MDDVLTVLMDGRVAGTITRLANNRLRLDHDPAYRMSRDATPLSLSLPLGIATHADTAESQPVTNVLWGLLPDDDRLIQRWAAHFRVRATSPFFLLGTPIGEDCAGAVAFCQPDAVERVLGRAGAVEWLSESDVEGILRDLRSDRTTWLGRDFTGRFSLAGAQAKTALLWDGSRWGRPTGSMPTSHILKPGAAGFRDQEVNEHLCLDAARRAGLPVASTRIVRFGQEIAIVVERFDRARSGATVRRLHQEDLCQALGVHPSMKYESDGGPGAIAIATLFRRSMPGSRADVAVRSFAMALAWNWIIGGTDAHAKNHSLSIHGGRVRFAPLYDMASFLPYLESRDPGDRFVRERDLRMAMKLGGTYDLAPPRNVWPRVAADLGMDKDELGAIVRALVDAAPTAFADAASEPLVAGLESPIVERLVQRVADRSARCAAVL